MAIRLEAITTSSKKPNSRHIQLANSLRRSRSAGARLVHSASFPFCTPSVPSGLRRGNEVCEALNQVTMPSGTKAPPAFVLGGRLDACFWSRKLEVTCFGRPSRIVDSRFTGLCGRLVAELIYQQLGRQDGGT